MSRVEHYERIRRDHRELGLGVRALAARHHVHRRTVRAALMSAVPAARKSPERVSPALGRWKPVIDLILLADQGVPVKQRHTARRVWQRLVAEHGADVAESTVRAYVGQWRAERRAVARVVTVPQVHDPGAEGEVDFGEVWLWLAGVFTKCFMFVFRLSASGRAVHRIYATQAQEAFFDGHVHAFEVLGGAPRRIRYDNLKAAVKRVLLGRDREESERFIALRSHYGFESFFCLPGKEGSHEKGGVEGEVGRFRRAWMVPVPEVATLAEVNALCVAADAAEDDRRIAQRKTTIGEDFAVEAPFLMVLPDRAFDAAKLIEARVDTKARVSVRQCFYSVPARLAGRRLPVRVGACRIEVLVGSKVVASHDRAVHRGEQVLVLDHYLEVLQVKPGALPGAAALAQARACGAFTETHQRFWDEARRRLGDAAGTRALIEALLLHRGLPAPAVIAGMSAALSAGVTDAKVVAVEARRAHSGAAAEVVPIGALAAYDRPAPTLDGYDALLAEGVAS